MDLNKFADEFYAALEKLPIKYAQDYLPPKRAPVKTIPVKPFISKTYLRYLGSENHTRTRDVPLSTNTQYEYILKEASKLSGIPEANIILVQHGMVVDKSSIKIKGPSIYIFDRNSVHARRTEGPLLNEYFEKELQDLLGIHGIDVTTAGRITKRFMQTYPNWIAE